MMREKLKKAQATDISVSGKEKVNMKLASACTLLWCIKVDSGMDIHLKTSWAPDVAEGEEQVEPKVINYGRVLKKTDRVSIPGKGTFSLMLDNSFAWFNTKGVKLTYVTAIPAAADDVLPIADSMPAAISQKKTLPAETTATATGTTTIAHSASEPATVQCPSKSVPTAMAGWTVTQVEGWLKACGLGEYAQSFTTKAIDGRCVRRLLDFSPKDQAEYMQTTFSMSISDSLHFGHELSKFAK